MLYDNLTSSNLTTIDQQYEYSHPSWKIWFYCLLFNLLWILLWYLTLYPKTSRIFQLTLETFSKDGDPECKI